MLSLPPAFIGSGAAGIAADPLRKCTSRAVFFRTTLTLRDRQVSNVALEPRCQTLLISLALLCQLEAAAAVVVDPAEIGSAACEQVHAVRDAGGTCSMQRCCALENVFYMTKAN